MTNGLNANQNQERVLKLHAKRRSVCGEAKAERDTRNRRWTGNRSQRDAPRASASSQPASPAPPAEARTHNQLAAKSRSNDRRKQIEQPAGSTTHEEQNNAATTMQSADQATRGAAVAQAKHSATTKNSVPRASSGTRWWPFPAPVSASSGRRSPPPAPALGCAAKQARRLRNGSAHSSNHSRGGGTKRCMSVPDIFTLKMVARQH